MNDEFSEGMTLLSFADENVDLRKAVLALLGAVQSQPTAMGWNMRTHDAVTFALWVLREYSPEHIVELDVHKRPLDDSDDW